eukprot:gene5465-5466_t
MCMPLDHVIIADMLGRGNSKADKVKLFVETVKCDKKVAQQLLERNGFQLEPALHDFFESGLMDPGTFKEAGALFD